MASIAGNFLLLRARHICVSCAFRRAHVNNVQHKSYMGVRQRWMLETGPNSLQLIHGCTSSLGVGSKAEQFRDALRRSQLELGQVCRLLGHSRLSALAPLRSPVRSSARLLASRASVRPRTGTLVRSPVRSRVRPRIHQSVHP